jgi:hypothetical protein
MVLRCILGLQAKQGALATALGKVRRIRSANREFLWIFVYLLRFAF